LGGLDEDTSDVLVAVARDSAVDCVVCGLSDARREPCIRDEFLRGWESRDWSDLVDEEHRAVIVDACEAHQELHVWSICGLLGNLHGECVDGFFEALELFEIHVEDRSFYRWELEVSEPFAALFAE